MKNKLRYQVIIGFLVLLLVGLNVVAPYLEQRKADRQTAMFTNFFDALALAKDNSQADALLHKYVVLDKPLAMSADADAGAGGACLTYRVLRNEFPNADSIWRHYYVNGVATISMEQAGEWDALIAQGIEEHCSSQFAD